MHDRVRSIVMERIIEYLDGQGQKVPAGLGPDTELLGRNGLLDSLGLVSVVIATEQSLQETFGRPVALADERAFSRRNSPFRSVESLSSYASELLSAAP